MLRLHVFGDDVFRVVIRVNGYNTTGLCLPRWIPLAVAQATTVPFKDISGHPLARGPTAEIGGDISSSDSRIPSSYQGVSMKHILSLLQDHKIYQTK